MPRPAKTGRQVRWFEDGELWCADDATPPVSPAGWYLRPPGTSVAWIGPFPTLDAAEAAPSGGDSFMAARRRLEAWVRASSRQEAGQQPTAVPASQVPPPAPAPVPKASAGDRGRAEDVPRSPVGSGTPRQLVLALDERAGAAAADEGDRHPARRSRRRRRGAAVQGDLPF